MVCTTLLARANRSRLQPQCHENARALSNNAERVVNLGTSRYLRKRIGSEGPRRTQETGKVEVESGDVVRSPPGRNPRPLRQLLLLHLLPLRQLHLLVTRVLRLLTAIHVRVLRLVVRRSIPATHRKVSKKFDSVGNRMRASARWLRSGLTT